MLPRITDKHLSHNKKIEQLLNEFLPPPYYQVLRGANEIANELGYPIYLAGGSVRDWLMGKTNLDLDLVVEGDGLIFTEYLATRLRTKYQLHKRYLTATIFLPGSFKLDIATTRTEYYPHPAALPRVRKGTLKEDLFRRDFTINTLAIRINGPEAPYLVDFFGGEKDLHEGIIKVLHPLSFVDDPTRILRALRFEQRFDFSLESDTLDYLRKAVEKAYLAQVKGARFFQELFLILSENRPLKVIQRMSDFDLLRSIHPKITFSRELQTLLAQVEDSLKWYHSLTRGDKIEEWFIYLLALVNDLNESDIEELRKRLALPINHARKALEDKEQAERTHQSLRTRSGLRPSQLVDALSTLSPEALVFLRAKALDDLIRKQITLYLTTYKEIKPRVTGKDLITLGIKPGPQFRHILHKIRELKLDGLLNGKSDEIEYIKEWQNFYHV